MRLSSFALYVFVGMIGIIATMITADHHPENPDPIFHAGIYITLAMFPLTFFARRKLDQALYGTKVTIDLQTYKVPSVCPETGRVATEPRMAHFTMTGGVAHVHGGFPVMLSPESAIEFDHRLLKNVKGMKVVRAAYHKITLYVKNEAYVQAMRESNRDTGAVTL